MFAFAIVDLQPRPNIGGVRSEIPLGHKELGRCFAWPTLAASVFVGTLQSIAVQVQILDSKKPRNTRNKRWQARYQSLSPACDEIVDTKVSRHIVEVVMHWPRLKARRELLFILLQCGVKPFKPFPERVRFS